MFKSSHKIRILQLSIVNKKQIQLKIQGQKLERYTKEQRILIVEQIFLNNKGLVAIFVQNMVGIVV